MARLRSKQWQAGDWYLVGKAEFGREFLRRARAELSLRIHGLDWATVQVYAVAARRFPESLRYLKISPSHYAAVAALPDGPALRLLEEAVKQNWTVSRLRFEKQKFEDAATDDDIRDDLMSEQRRYRCLMADPPWLIWPTRSKPSGSDAHYPPMEADAIKALPVQRIADPRAFLFLWSPVVNAPVALDTMAAWGFQFVTRIDWHKLGAIGTGNYLRMCTEDLWIGRRPNAPRRFRERLSSLLEAPRGKHSAKPDAIYDDIERACLGPRIELFARKRRKGWTQYGNQLAPLALGDSDDQLLLAAE